MNILLATLELAPYVQNSSAAESVASLAKALKLLGHDVTIAAPRLPAYEESGLLLARQLSRLELSAPARKAMLFDVQLSSGAKLTLIEVEGESFDPSRPLSEQSGSLGGFSSAVAALAKAALDAGTPFDAVHAHDASAGLSLLKLESKVSAGLGRVLSVHDAAHAGEFEAGEAGALGIPEDRLSSHGFGTTNGLCLLKGLLVEADAVVTPSDSYGRQLQAPERYGALARAFQGASLVGIPEGVDQAVFNPSTDAALTSRYDAPDPSNKARNKAATLKELGLHLELERPVVFCENVEEGDCAFDTLLGALPGIIRSHATLIILGPSGTKKDNLQLLEPFSDRAAWISDASPELRRRILAASDFYLSIQRRNPSGRTLLQAARYGAVPVAFRTDAVGDVVVDADAELKTGTGILFDTMNQRALTSAVGRAVGAYRSEGWKKLLSRVMRQDTAWDRSARRHLQVYRTAAAHS